MSSICPVWSFDSWWTFISCGKAISALFLVGPIVHGAFLQERPVEAFKAGRLSVFLCLLGELVALPRCRVKRNSYAQLPCSQAIYHLIKKLTNIGKSLEKKIITFRVCTLSLNPQKKINSIDNPHLLHCGRDPWTLCYLPQSPMGISIDERTLDVFCNHRSACFKQWHYMGGEIPITPSKKKLIISTILFSFKACKGAYSGNRLLLLQPGNVLMEERFITQSHRCEFWRSFRVTNKIQTWS